MGDQPSHLPFNPSSYSIFIGFASLAIFKEAELAYYFCLTLWPLYRPYTANFPGANGLKIVIELNMLKWSMNDFFCSLPELKQRNST